jgi:hypothetical protein
VGQGSQEGDQRYFFRFPLFGARYRYQRQPVVWDKSMNNGKKKGTGDNAKHSGKLGM